MSEANSTQYWAGVFLEQHVANVEGVFELGRRFEECADVGGERLLLDAGELAGYKKRSINQLRAVSRSERMGNNVTLLPSSWGALYGLTILNDGEWADALAANAIHPEMTRADARKLRRP